MVGADFRRFSSRVNTDIRITDWLKGSAQLSYSNARYNKSVQDTNASNNALNFVNNAPYLYPVYERDEMVISLPIPTWVAIVTTMVCMTDMVVDTQQV